VYRDINLAYDSQDERQELDYYSTTDEPSSSNRDSCSPTETKLAHGSPSEIRLDPMMMDWGSFRYPNMPTRPAIVVQSGKKSYGKYKVLVNLNMTVPEKSM